MKSYCMQLLTNSKLSSYVALVLGVIILVSLFTVYIKWGPGLTSDTIAYLHMAKEVSVGQFPYSEVYSPGYPILIGLASKLSGISPTLVAVFTQVLLATIFAIGFYRLLLLLSDSLAIQKPFRGWMFLTIICSWWLMKLLVIAHADLLFLAMLIWIMVLLVKWLLSSEYSNLIAAGVLSMLSVWVKYNGLVLIPFFAFFPLFYFGLKRKALRGLPIAIFILLSFLLFRGINGTAIHHVEAGDRSLADLILTGGSETLLINLTDGGRAMFETLINQKFAGFLPDAVSLMLFIIVLITSLYLVFQTFGRLNVLSVLGIWAVGYLVSFIILQQGSGHQETGTRTISHALIFLLPFLFLNLFGKSKRVAWGILLVTFLCNIAMTSAAILDWYKRAPMDSFVFAKAFEQRESFLKLKEIAGTYQIPASQIYSNEFRYLTLAFDYQFIRRIPTTQVFERGRKREVSEDTRQINVENMIAYSKSNPSIIAVFNDDNLHEYLMPYLVDFQSIHLDKDHIYWFVP